MHPLANPMPLYELGGPSGERVLKGLFSALIISVGEGAEVKLSDADLERAKAFDCPTVQVIWPDGPNKPGTYVFRASRRTQVAQ